MEQRWGKVGGVAWVAWRGAGRWRGGDSNVGKVQELTAAHPTQWDAALARVLVGIADWSCWVAALARVLVGSAEWGCWVAAHPKQLDAALAQFLVGIAEWGWWVWKWWRWVAALPKQ